MRVHNKDLCCTEIFPDLLKSTDHLSNPSWPNHLIYCTYKLWLSTLQKEKQVTCLCISFTHFLIFILHMMFPRSWRKIWVILLNSIFKIMFSTFFHKEFEKFKASSQTNKQTNNVGWGKKFRKVLFLIHFTKISFISPVSYYRFVEWKSGVDSLQIHLHHQRNSTGCRQAELPRSRNFMESGWHTKKSWILE